VRKRNDRGVTAGHAATSAVAVGDGAIVTNSSPQTVLGRGDARHGRRLVLFCVWRIFMEESTAFAIPMCLEVV
ncbi:MAG TPA: hypothetical protein VED19_00085, partial [Candidatus Nitrosopolaris sp.]|nr:hypothetical protein [Candidatus Nitrosopolaris sp.]